MLPSAADSTVVPNSSTPPLPLTCRITCTRCPATSGSQSESIAAGTNSRSAVDPIGFRQQQLADQILDQTRLVSADAEHRRQVVRPDRQRQIGDVALLQELRRPTRERPEQQPRLAVDDARVEMRCTQIGGAPSGGLPYTLARCAAASTGLAVRRNRPPTGNPPNPLTSGMPDFCSSGSAPPPAPTNTNLAFSLRFSPGAAVDDVRRPAAVGLLAEIAHLVTEQGGHAASRRVADELSGQRPEVDVGAVRRPVRAPPARRSRAWRPSAAAGGRTRPCRR